MHRADARTGQHRDRSLRNIRQINNNAIALLDFVSFQDVRESADFVMQLLIGESALVAWFALPENRCLVSARTVQMPVETVFRDIEFAANKPFRVWRFPVENFFPRPAPDQLACLAPPEFGRLPDRFSIHSPILLETFDSRALREVLGRFQNALLDQVRFDVVVHGQSLICRRNSQSKRSVFSPADVETNPGSANA